MRSNPRSRVSFARSPRKMRSRWSSARSFSGWIRFGEATHSILPAFNFKQAITHMVQRSGSDLLLKVGRPATIRVNGDLVSLDTAPLKPEELKSLAEQIMTPRQVKEFAEHKEAGFAIRVPGGGRFRANA